MSNIAISNKSAEKILSQLKDIQSESHKLTQGDSGKADSKSFSEYLKDGINDVNASHKVADHMATELATGKSGNIHETMLAATKAELSFNLMVQIRNKALEAYSEIMRMPV